MPSRQKLRLRLRPGRCGPTPAAFYEAALVVAFRAEDYPGDRLVCSAVARSTGKRCGRLAAYQTSVCQWHGAREVLRELGLLAKTRRVSKAREMRIGRQSEHGLVAAGHEADAQAEG